MKNIRIGIGIYLLNEKNEILLGKRKGSYGAGTWAPPGGHLEFGETVAASAKRECFEETGLLVEGIRLLTFTDDIYPDLGVHYLTLFVQATPLSFIPKMKEPEKCECWEWFSKKDLPSPLFPSFKNFLEKETFKLCEI